MSALRDSIVHLADRIVRNPEERDLLSEALRVKISEMRKRGEAVPEEILKLERALERKGASDDPWNDLPL